MPRKTSKQLDSEIFFGLKLDPEQRVLRDTLFNDDIDIVFVNAPAGCGKTLISVGCADILVNNGHYDKLLYLFSPTQYHIAGFLPGSQEEKESPYTTPLCDALIKLGHNPTTVIVSEDNVENVKNGNAWVEAKSHIYMRGCNFENRFIIIDEAQNFTFDEMKKVLTRINDAQSKTVVIGHSGQCDIVGNISGFEPYMDWFSDMPRCAICKLKTNHRGWLSTHADKMNRPH
jgi:predicted ribonuclease YlaK